MSALTHMRNLSPAVADRLSSMANRLSNMREKEKEAVDKGLRTAVAGLTGLGIGFMEGAYGRTEIMGAPLAGAVGAVGTVLAWTQTGDLAKLASGFGDAGVAIYAKGIGVELGQKWAEKD